VPDGEFEKDIALSEVDAKDMTASERDTIVGNSVLKLRLNPGCYLVGCMRDWQATDGGRGATLVNISSLDRSEEEISACLELLPTASGGILIRFIRIAIGILEDVHVRHHLTTRVAVAALVKAQTDADGRLQSLQAQLFNMGKKSLGLRHCTQATPR